MSQVTWILHHEILERLVYHGRSLPDAIAAAGHVSEVVSWESGEPIPQLVAGYDQPTVLFGGHSFVRQANPDGRYQPGNLGVSDRTRVTSYMSNLPIDWFMNRDGMFMTWAMFKQRRREFFYQWDTDRIFIRPDSGLKTFAGTPIKYGTLDFDIETLDKLSSVMDETLIMVAPSHNIKGEFRFVIADGKVVTGSEYRWDGKLDIRRDWTPECEDLARMVAEHPWQIDIAYTCDVALLEDSVKLVELNGFSCAGLYACDLDKVVRAVSDAAVKEFYGHDI